MKMRMILPASASAGNGGGTQGNQNNGGNQMGGQMNGMPQNTMPMQQPLPQSMPHMPMPHAGPSPHAMPHHDPSGGGYQNNMGAMNAGMNTGMNGMNMMAGGYGARGASNMEMGMAAVMPLPMAGGGQMAAAQARAMGFATNPEDYDGYGAESYEAEARRRRSRRTGRFIRGAADEGYDMEMRGGSRMRGLEMHGGGDDDDDEEMGFASSKPGGSTKALKKKVKMLEKKIEALQEALEEQDEGSPGKKAKKKKPKPEPDDEDDEEDGAGESPESTPDLSRMLAEAVSSKEFLKQLPTILTAVVEVIKNPPPTWPPYIAKNDLSGIFTMEARELMKAIEQYKAGQKPAQDVCKEMKHAGAALIQMYATLLQTINTEQPE